MQATMEAVGVPDVLKQLIWDPVVVNDAQPVNATEAALAQLIDDQLRVRSTSSIAKFLKVFQQSKTEADQALVLIVLRATATGSDGKLAEACTAAFEQAGGLKITKKWLTEAVEWNYTDLLVLLLDVLKVLPVQLTSITEARINEPVVKLRKEAQEDKVRRAAQELLKHWRNRFTEKDKAKSSPNGSPKNATSSAAPVADHTATASSTSALPKTAAEVALNDAKPLKKRPIKRLERTVGSGSAGSAPAKSSELIGNLMQRKSAKDAGGASKSSKDAVSSSSSSTSSAVSSSTDANKQSSGSSSTASSSSSSKPDGVDKPTDDIVMQLPAIQSFKAVATTKVTKKIRWADEEGKELTKIKLIESWRDMIHYQPQHDENTFKDAKLREHEAERQMMKSHKEREAFHVVMAHEWTTPALFQMPEALASRRAPIQTEEVEAQSTRTRREMEFMVLDGEVPPLSPKEWTRSNEPHRGAPKEIPLLDVDSAAAAQAAVAPPSSSYSFPGETEEERALREALGPLERSTIALLMENERVLPMVYEEAQRNGNRIPDSRVVEIIDYHRRQSQPMHQPYHHQQPPPLAQRYGGGPPPQPFDNGFGRGFNNGPPGAGGGGYDYNPPNRGPFQQQPPPMHHQPLKRKAPGVGGVLSDMPPPAKRMAKRGPNGAPLQ